MRFARFVLRATAIALLLASQGIAWFVGWLALLVTLRSRATRQQWFARRLLALFRNLGATFIKVGQIMSTRPDLFPPHVIGALEKLQDEVGAFPYRHVRSVFCEEFGKPPDEIFASFAERPIASASVAQVHDATLMDGTRVAVKVRRPKLELIVGLDLRIMRITAQVMCVIPSVRLLAPVESVDQFANAIRMQMDLSLEADNNRRFQQNFAGDPAIRFPALVDAYCSRRVLTMEFIDGVKVLDYDPSISNPTRLARTGFRLLMQMIFRDGFVHADLHPGNIFVTRADQVVILDLGLTADLADSHRRSFARYFAAWATANGQEMARLMAELAPGTGEVRNYPVYEADVIDFVARYHGKPLGEVSTAQVAFDLMGILRRHRIRVNATFTMVNIAIAVTEGIGKQLAPELDLMTEALPYFAELQARAQM